MIQFNPELAKSSPSDGVSSIQSSSSGRPESYSSDRGRDSPASRAGSISSRYSLSMGQGNNLDSITESVPDDDEIPVGHHFTYIPSNPKKFYKRLVERCLQADLEAMATLPEDQEVSLGILSPRHLEVINECAVRWRIAQSYRVTCFVDIIRYMYEREEVPLECIPEGLQMIQKAMQETELNRWPRADVRLNLPHSYVHVLMDLSGRLIILRLYTAQSSSSSSARCTRPSMTSLSSSEKI